MASRKVLHMSRDQVSLQVIKAVLKTPPRRVKREPQAEPEEPELVKEFHVKAASKPESKLNVKRELVKAEQLANIKCEPISVPGNHNVVPVKLELDQVVPVDPEISSCRQSVCIHRMCSSRQLL